MGKLIYSQYLYGIQFWTKEDLLNLSDVSNILNRFYATTKQMLHFFHVQNELTDDLKTFTELRFVSTHQNGTVLVFKLYNPRIEKQLLFSCYTDDVKEAVRRNMVENVTLRNRVETDDSSIIDVIMQEHSYLEETFYP